MERIQKYKKTMKRIRMFTIAPFILMVVLVLGSLSDWTYSGLTVSGGIAGLVIGVIYDYRKNRELNAKIKDILDKIKELRGE
jgi:O-antigen/teichoic acid export membrane protein